MKCKKTLKIDIKNGRKIKEEKTKKNVEMQKCFVMKKLNERKRKEKKRIQKKKKKKSIKNQRQNQ